MSRRTSVGCFVFWLVCGLPTVASAEPSDAEATAVDAKDATTSADKRISAALSLGYVSAVAGPTDLNAFGIGFGLRGGYELGQAYLGARFLFFLGDSHSSAGVKYSRNVTLLAADAGYDVDFDRFTLRPQLAIGLAITSGEGPGSAAVPDSSVDTSSVDLYLGPGAALSYAIDDSAFVGGELQLHVVFERETSVGVGAMAIGGMRF